MFETRRSTFLREPWLKFESTLRTLFTRDRKTRWLLRTAFLMFCFAAPTTSQEPKQDIEIGGQRFEIGMAKDTALAKVDACCVIMGDRSSDLFQFESRVPSRAAGSIQFAAGRVVRLTRDEGQYHDQEAVLLARALYVLLSESSHS